VAHSVFRLERWYGIIVVRQSLLISNNSEAMDEVKLYWSAITQSVSIHLVTKLDLHLRRARNLSRFKGLLHLSADC
jgi:hypothetical protein